MQVEVRNVEEGAHGEYSHILYVFDFGDARLKARSYLDEPDTASFVTRLSGKVVGSPQIREAAAYLRSQGHVHVRHLAGAEGVYEDLEV